MMFIDLKKFLKKAKKGVHVYRSHKVCNDHCKHRSGGPAVSVV